MREVLNIINQIAATSSRTEKESILTKNKDNKKLKSLLQFVYNPYIVTGLSKKKINKDPMITDRLNNDFNTYEDVVEYLKQNNTGRDIDICRVQNFIYKHDIDFQDFYKQVFTKELTIGVTSKTLNKVYGKRFIPEFSVMLADKYWDYENKIKGKEFIVTTKLDGLRNVAIVENGSVSMFTRQGQLQEGFNDIVAELSKFPDGVYDGELIATNPDNLNSADLYRRTMTIARKDGIKKDLVFHVFDYIHVNEFKNGYSKMPCRDRKLLAIEIIGMKNPTWIQYVKPLYVGNDTSLIIKWLDDITNLGGEGVMVSLADSPYECKRSKNLLKVKKFNEADVLVTGMVEGTGKYVGKLGAIKVKFETNGQYYESEIGTGFSDHERELYWNNPDMIMNRIVTIGYFEVSENQNGGKGLRFGTWKSIIRDDKNEISMY